MIIASTTRFAMSRHHIAKLVKKLVLTAFSSAWAMLAASSVVGCSIQSVYPPRNGFLDKAIGILNTIFNPMGAKTRDIIAVMWSSGSYE